MTVPRKLRLAATALGSVALLFGALTILSGGRVLFGDAAARAAAGAVVPFVLWFNFIAGFAYVTAGIGLVAGKEWSVWLSAAIAVTTVLVFAAFGVHVWNGGAYELRTVGAMSARSIVWTGIAVIALRLLKTSSVRFES